MDLTDGRWLFVKFFIRSYVNRTAQSKHHSSLTHNLEKSGEDAFKGVERKVSEAVVAEAKTDETEIPPEISARFEQAKTTLKDASERSLEVANGKVETVREWIEERIEHVETKESTIEDDIKQEIDEVEEPINASSEEGIEPEVNGTEESKEAIVGDDEVDPQSEGDNAPEESTADEEVRSDKTQPTADEEVHSDHHHEADSLNESGYEINESAYEANFDQLKNEAEDKAEEEMQPNGA